MELVWLPECQQWAFEFTPKSASAQLTGSVPWHTTRRPKRVGIKDSIFYATCSPTSSGISLIDRRRSVRTICWTRQRRLGRRSGGTGVKPFPFAHLNVTRRDYRWRSSTNADSVKLEVNHKVCGFMMGASKRGGCNGKPPCGGEEGGSDEKAPGSGQESGKNSETEGGR